MLKLLKTALVLAALGSSLVAQSAVVVRVDPLADWTGFMNWFDMPADGGGFVAQGFWSAADLSSSFANSTLTLAPNTSLDRDVPDDAYWWKPDGSSNKVMGANLFVNDDSLIGQDIVFTGMVLSNTLAPGYSARAVIRVFNFNYSIVVDTFEAPLQDGQMFEVTYQSAPTDAHIQYAFEWVGPNARIGNRLGSVVIATVPEPSTGMAAACALLALVAIRRRRPRA